MQFSSRRQEEVRQMHTLKCLRPAVLSFPGNTAKLRLEIVTLLDTSFRVFLLFIFHLLDNLADSAEEALCSWEISGHLEVRLPDFLWNVLTDLQFLNQLIYINNIGFRLRLRLQERGLNTYIQI